MQADIEPHADSKVHNTICDIWRRQFNTPRQRFSNQKTEVEKLMSSKVEAFR